MKPIAAFLFPLVLALSACDNSSENARAKAMQSEIDALTQKQFEAQQAAKRLQSQIEASRAERAKLEEERDKVSTERDAARKEVEQMKKEFENYKTLYKVSIRNRAPGMELGDFAIEGTLYHQVKISKLTETMLNFTHGGGIGKIELKQLPFYLQAILGYAEDEGPRAIVATKPLTQKAKRNQDRADLEKIDDERRAIQDNLAEVNKRISAADAQKQTAAARHLPILPLTQYLEHLHLTKLRIEMQLTEVDLNRHELLSKQRNTTSR